jgi:hypothetical protein
MIQVVLGSESDDELFERLNAEVCALGGTIADTEWVLGGSQEVTIYKIRLPSGELEAVAETYVGLFLRGEVAQVTALAQRVMPNKSLQSAAYGGG